MIKYNNNTINDWNFGTSNLIKVYRNNAIVFYKVSGTPPSPTSQTPCFAVVDDISQYSDTEFEDVYDKATDKWYKLNNLNAYEEYGVYGSGRTITTYEGKLTIDEYTQPSRLPSGYTEVEYIRQNSSYNAYIDTGVIPYGSVGNSFEVSATMKAYYKNTTCDTFLSCEDVNSPYFGFGYRFVCAGGSNYQIFGSDGNTATTVTNNSDGTFTYVCSRSNVTTIYNMPISLFCSYENSSYTRPYRFSDIEVHSMSITLNNEVVRNYVPAKRDSDNKYGLYDLVTDTFYVSPNGNNFVGGSEVNPPKTCEFIYSGDSWSNLGEVSGSTYPLYYAEKSDPPNNLSFSSMTEAEEYECPWVGMEATIDGVSYIFSGDSISGYEWVMDESIDYSVRYLTLVAETDGVTYKYDTYTTNNRLQYSTDSGTTWNELANGSSTPSVNNGDKVLFKGSGLTVDGERGLGRITPSASASVEGNIMSLAYGDNFSGQTVVPNNYQFRKLFSGVTTITSAENMVIPATTIKKQCYSQMFQGCSNLVTAPKVIGSSAMTWSGDYCWSDMFNSCTSLVNAPQLPALNLGAQCYWFMFQNCTSLTTAPELLATTTATQCYNGMFSGCMSLNYIKVMASNGFNMNDWVNGVASSGTFIKNSSATFSSCGKNTYPCNWTVQNA